MPPDTPPATQGQIIQFPSQFESMKHYSPHDLRGFRLNPEGMTPFEQHGMRAWDEYDARGAIEGIFKPPTHAKSFGSGLSWHPLEGFGAMHIEPEYKKRKAMLEAEFAEREKAGKLSLPGESLKDKLQELAALREKDLSDGRLKQAKMVRHAAYARPNSLWQNPPRNMLLAALSLRGGGRGTPNNEHLDKLHQSQGMPDARESVAAELALFRAIRAVHPDWEPPEGVETLMPHEDYMGLMGKGEPMRIAFMLLKAYSLGARR